MSHSVENLQSAVSHLQKTVDELSDVVARQDRQIDRLERRLGILMEREAERELNDGGSVPLADQKPPHW